MFQPENWRKTRGGALAWKAFSEVLRFDSREGQAKGGRGSERFNPRLWVATKWCASEAEWDYTKLTVGHYLWRWPPEAMSQGRV